MYCESTAYLYAPLKIHTMTFDLDVIAPITSASPVELRRHEVLQARR